MREGHLHHSGIYRNINKRQHLICIRGWGRGNSYVLRMGVVTKDCCQSDKEIYTSLHAQMERRFNF